jgi:RimJ/RimL family protein N-acetyltransferase
MVELVRLSGYRLQKLPPEQFAYKWQALRTTVAQYASLLQDFPDGFYRDDGAKGMPLLDLLMSKLQGGELYFAFLGKAFVGMAAITDIAYGRNAYIEAIANPEFYNSHAVGKAMGELVTYAFKDFGDAGLGLKKLKAGVVESNARVINLLWKAGFVPVGVMRGEALCAGVPYDMILLELLNPKYFAVDKQVISNGKGTTASDVPAGSAIPITGGIPGGVGSDSSDGAPSGGAGELDHGGWPELVESEPVQQQHSGATGGTTGSSAPAESQQLVHAE